jgi:hypothetical protein
MEGCLDGLGARGLKAPLLCIIDGHAGLRRAVGEAWARAAVQRCGVHKLRNLERKAPKHVLDDPRQTSGRDFLPRQSPLQPLVTTESRSHCSAVTPCGHPDRSGRALRDDIPCYREQASHAPNGVRGCSLASQETRTRE